jgi:hypothetical protein
MAVRSRVVGYVVAIDQATAGVPGDGGALVRRDAVLARGSTAATDGSTRFRAAAR